MVSYRLGKIRKAAVSLPLFFIFFIFVHISSAAQTDKVVRIGIYSNPPLVSQTDTGEPQGLFVDLIETIASQEGWKNIFVFDTFSNCLQQLRDNELNMLAAIAHTKKRETFLDFSQEIVCTLWGTVYVQPKSKIQSILDLDGKKIAIMQKGVFGSEFKKLCNDFNIHCNFQETASQNISLKLLKEKKVDAAIFNNAFKGIYNEPEISKTSIIYSPLKIGVATNKGKNAELRK